MPRLCLSLLLSLLMASSTSAVTIDDAIDGLWQEFQFGGPGSFAVDCVTCVPSSGGNSEFAGNPPWTFTALTPLLLTITDTANYGDHFAIYNFGNPRWATPNVNAGGACANDPEVCVADPLSSSGVFSLAPGTYSLTIQVIDSPFFVGAGYFRLDTIPEPGTGLLVIAGLVGLVVHRRGRA